MVYDGPNKRKSTWSNIILLVITIILLFVILEVVVRIFFVIIEPGTGYPLGLHQPSEALGFEYVPNFRGKFPGGQFDDIWVNISSLGFRDQEYSQERSDNVFRILLLGDSVTFGTGVPHSSTFDFLLEEKLNSIDGSSYEVINMGVNSYSFEHELEQFKEKGLGLNPNLVVLNFVLNDIGPIDVPTTSGLFLGNKWKARTYAEKYCKLCKFVYINTYLVWHSRGQPSYAKVYFDVVMNSWEAGDDLEYTKKHFIEFMDVLETNNIELFVVIYPFIEQYEYKEDYENPILPQEELKEFFDPIGVKYLDLYSYIEEDYNSYYLSHDNVHLNEKGHVFVSDMIFDNLVEEVI